MLFHQHPYEGTPIFRYEIQFFFKQSFPVFDEYRRKPISLIPTVKKEGLTGKKGKNTMVAIEVAKKSERKKNGN